MSTGYLIRLDDACPTMDGAKWGMVEDALDRHRIRPLVAVVPDNTDPDLHVDPPDPLFWEKVRRWDAKGWTIAMHGFQHQFHSVDRSSLLLPFYDRSEFAGLSYELQAEKIRNSWRLFKDAGIEPRMWIAPAHCFDGTTLAALKAETPIRVISDGIARRPFFQDGFYWLPQQLWSLSPKKWGLWTVCLHPNTMTSAQISDFARALESPAFAGNVFGLSDIELTHRPRSLADVAFSTYFWQRKRLFEIIGGLRLRWASRAHG